MKNESPYPLHVRRAGQGPTLVLIHGVAGSGAIWGDVATALEKNFDVIRLDLLGYGYSPKPNVTYSMRLHIETIRATLARLHINHPVSLVGLSMGSLICLEYAVRYPLDVSHIACIGLPYYESRARAKQSLRASFWANLVIQKPALAKLLIPMLWGAGKNKRLYSIATKLRKQDGLVYKGEMARESMMANYHSFSSTLEECMVGFRSSEGVESLNVPILFVHGEEDKWTPFKTIAAFAAKLRYATVVMIPKRPHNIVSFAPLEVSAAIETFLGNTHTPTKIKRAAK